MKAAPAQSRPPAGRSGDLAEPATHRGNGTDADPRRQGCRLPGCARAAEEQIHTSAQAGGMASPTIRSSVFGIRGVLPVPMVREASTTPTTGDAWSIANPDRRRRAGGNDIPQPPNIHSAGYLRIVKSALHSDHRAASWTRFLVQAYSGWRRAGQDFIIHSRGRIFDRLVCEVSRFCSPGKG